MLKSKNKDYYEFRIHALQSRENKDNSKIINKLKRKIEKTLS